MKILSIGVFKGISNTCLHRHWALKKNAEDIDVVDMFEKPVSVWFRISHHLFLCGFSVKLPDTSKANNRVIELCAKKKYDIVWIDKGIVINKETLQYIKTISPETIIISYSPDNMALRHNQSQNYLECIPLYDYIFTNKSYILDDMKKLGAKAIRFINNSYESKFHFPRVLTPDDYKNLGGDVGFVGSWEKERCDSVIYLAKHGIKIRIFGSKEWQKYKNISENLIIEDHGLYGEDYSKSFQAFKISLSFLRKINFDQQTTRSIEIPACGGFMLAERTEEHLSLFEEGKEADFFSTNEELLDKCKYYLSHDEERRKIAEAGLHKCINADYSNTVTIKEMLNYCYINR